ncbi:MAG TPA: hypothetical protein VLB44_09395, partial [Kofleriaceae bacterium]|nr:hypothetical protein [Kofleriaceae bacterium]
QVPLDAARARTPSGQMPRLRTPSSQFPTVDATRSAVGDGPPRTRPPTSPGVPIERVAPEAIAERVKALTSADAGPSGGSGGEPRTKPPSQPPLIHPVGRARTSSSGPIDLAARLSAAAPAGVLEPLAAGGSSIEVAIRAPLPSPEPVPPDQIPVAPESGLTIRKRTTSTAPPPPPQVSSAIRYVALRVELTTEGIHGTREDGLDKLIAWKEIGSVVARRLPPEPPFDGATFIDIVSSAGSTMRILPSTRIVGGLPLPDVSVERARSLLQLVAAQALEAKLDAATRLFADSDGQAVQLPTAAVLATHDDRFA